MDLTKSAQPPRQLDRCDLALLGAYVVVAGLGTWQSCLLVNDVAVYLAAAWLGNAWDLAYGQVPSRAIATLIAFGPGWAVRVLSDPSPAVFVAMAHLLCFAALLVPWLMLRAVEPQRLFSRLYLAMVLPLTCFPSEIIVGTGLWMLWLAVIAVPQRSRAAQLLATILIAPTLVLTHPGVALLAVVFAAVGGILILFGRPFPRRLAVAATAMAAFLVAGYFVTTAFLPPGPLQTGQLDGGKYNYIDPIWLLGTLAMFPMVAATWLLMAAPGLQTARVRWQLPPLAVTIVGLVGLWFAFNGTNLLTWMFARQTAPYALALALALALASDPAAWLAAARRCFLFIAMMAAVASLSYTIDLWLFGRAADARLAPLIAAGGPAPNIAAMGQASPAAAPTPLQGLFKWAAAPGYARDILAPYYGAERMTFAFYSFFRSDRRAVLYKKLDKKREWVPFECAPVDRALASPHEDVDTHMLRFIRENYCVP